MAPARLIAALALWGGSSAAKGLEVIGSGFGRTGTESMRTALTELGYTTYHMKEIVDGSLYADVRDWNDLAEKGCSSDEAKLKGIFERGGWTAAVDFPASMCWEALAKAYPDAKVVHTQRASFDDWWTSASNSIFSFDKRFPVSLLFKVAPFFVQQKAMVDAMWVRLLGRRVDGATFPDAYKEDWRRAYDENNARVTKAVPHQRLLLQNHSNGWGPLCAFLQKPVPAKPFPHTNTTAEFQAFFRTLAFTFVAACCGALVAVALAARAALRFLSPPKQKEN